MNITVRRAIEDVYASFRDVPKPQTIEGCPHCLDRPGVELLLARPLRELTPEDLTSYVSSAFLTLGCAEDYLYFLPRILEILANAGNTWFEPEVVGRAINSAGFTNWPPQRRIAVLHYFDQVFSDLLKQDQCGCDIDSWICTLAKMGVDLAPYLDRIAAHGPRLIEFLEWNNKELQTDDLFNGFWDDVPAAKRQVIEWFHSMATESAINKAYAAMWGYSVPDA